MTLEQFRGVVVEAFADDTGRVRAPSARRRASST
jgi:hypothetical protein